MYYRRHRRSYRRRHNAKRHVFGKKAVRAIKAISQRPVETKFYEKVSGLGSNPVGPAIWSGNSAYMGHNLWANVPRADSAGTHSRTEVIGQSAQARGFSIKWLMYYPAVGAALQHVFRVRISVVKATDFFDFDNYDQWGAVSGTAVFWDQEDDGSYGPATFQRFNQDAVKVIKSRSFTLSGGGQTNWMSEGKMWVPLRSKITAIDPEAEPPAATDVMGRIKGWQYYLLLEFFDPAGLVTTAENYYLTINSRVYFKDA